jgi:hypothetical protein
VVFIFVRLSLQLADGGIRRFDPVRDMHGTKVLILQVLLQELYCNGFQLFVFF